MIGLQDVEKTFMLSVWGVKRGVFLRWLEGGGVRTMVFRGLEGNGDLGAIFPSGFSLTEFLHDFYKKLARMPFYRSKLYIVEPIPPDIYTLGRYFAFLISLSSISRCRMY